MGWEFIDDIVWVKPEASVKNRNAGFLQHRKPLGYKPNAISEMIMVYRKKTDKLIDWNISQYNWDKVKKVKLQINMRQPIFGILLLRLIECIAQFSQ